MLVQRYFLPVHVGISESSPPPTRWYSYLQLDDTPPLGETF